MDKFSKEFYASRLEDWITKYIKVKELLKLIKSIEKDIKKKWWSDNSYKRQEIYIIYRRISYIKIIHPFGPPLCWFGCPRKYGRTF